MTKIGAAAGMGVICSHDSIKLHVALITIRSTCPNGSWVLPHPVAGGGWCRGWVGGGWMGGRWCAGVAPTAMAISVSTSYWLWSYHGETLSSCSVSALEAGTVPDGNRAEERSSFGCLVAFVAVSFSSSTQTRAVCARAPWTVAALAMQHAQHFRATRF